MFVKKIVRYYFPITVISKEKSVERSWLSFLFFQRKRNILSFTIGTISLGTLTFEVEYIKLDSPKDLIISTFP